jgi:PAS domain S-box-containing protein
MTRRSTKASFPLDDWGRRLQAAAKVGAWCLAVEDRRLWWTDGMYELHDLEPAAPVTIETALGHYAPPQRAKLEAALTRSMATGEAFSLELPYTTGSGRAAWAQIKGERTEHRGETYVFGVQQDISERMALDEELRRHRQFLEKIVTHIPDMVFVKEAEELRFVLFNQAGEQLLGLRNDQLIGHNDYDFFPREQAAHFVEKDREVLASRRLMEIEEEPIDTPRGRRILHTKKIPLLNDDGKPLYLLGISRDITEKKRADEVIESQRHALLMSSKLSALGQMAGGIAHEINNPLTIINGLANLLQFQAIDGKLDPDKVLSLAGRVRDTVGRISRIVKSLRRISRDEAGEPLQAVAVKEVLSETLALCSEKFKSRGVELRALAVPDRAWIEGRMTEVSQVVLNLLGNAQDAVLEAEVEERWIEVGVEVDTAVVRLTVTDSGKGIPVAHRDKVMLPFFTTKAVGKGTGLGLSISKSIVEGLGGRLWLDEGSALTRFVAEFRRAELPEIAGLPRSA